MAQQAKPLIDHLPYRLEKAVSSQLLADEQADVKLKGAFQEALICTNRRVLIVKRGFMTGHLFGSETFQASYANIAGVQVNFHLMTGYFEVSQGGMQNRATSYWTGGAEKLPNCVSLNNRRMKEAFQQACAFIMNRIEEERRPVIESGRVVPGSHSRAGTDAADILSAIERLAKLKSTAVISEEEFTAKKNELLSRL